MNNQTQDPLHLSTEQLIDAAVANNEGVIASNGAFSTTTGEEDLKKPKR